MQDQPQPPAPLNRPSLPEVPDIPPFLRGATPDEKALAEQQGFTNRNLEEIAGRNEHRRSEKLRDHVARAAVCLFWFGVGIAGIAVGITAWHDLAPESWGWLSKAQLDKLHAMLLSGAVASALGAYAQRYFGKSN